MSAKEILNTIIQEFDITEFTAFFQKKTPDFRKINEDLPYFNDENLSLFFHIGTLENPDKNVAVICAKVEKNLNERSGKKLQYEKAKTILKNLDLYEAGIFIFYDEHNNFRFSLVYPEYQGTKRIWNNFRRFTYFVSKELTNKTFLQRIGEDNDFFNLTKIKEAFSVEKVTSAFFEECRKVFERTKQEFERSNKHSVCEWLKSNYSEEEYNEQINKFAYLFIGRIIFIYFLMRKGWIEDKKDFIRHIVQDKSKNILYTTFFQPLFFDVFSKKENDRPKEIKEQYRNTPYLNGGLFERSPLETEMENSGKYILFSDQFIRDIILNFFETYNFTVDENSLEDQEVSIDPEMLGKVFENTLAEEERGKKGTFYTPREIVHFMVKEALLHYLINETHYKQELLHELIYDDSFDFSAFDKNQIRLIDKKLESVKIIDPAVGSAAFPVEMMNTLVHIRKKLNVTVGNNINEVTLKKLFIKNNLYGVDIDPGAIEIAKLRMWLALIVDYEKTEIEPLPNLDFQFRVGNSLQEKIDDIDVFNEEDLGSNHLYKETSEYEKLKERMIRIKDHFYTSENEIEKKKLKKQFDELEHGLINAALNEYYKDMLSHTKNMDPYKSKKIIEQLQSKISKLEERIKDGTYKLFKPDFHFSEVYDRKDEDGVKISGFDIVIGNPPYGVDVEDDTKESHALGNKDSYGVFISTSLKRFLKPKGILSFIVSDTWLTIRTHRNLRVQVLNKQLHSIIRLNQDCFDATVNACIVVLSNIQDINNILIAADLTNLSTRKDIDIFREKLYRLEEYRNYSKPEFAVYCYPQKLILSNSNLPIFVANPKIFTLMNDGYDETKSPKIKKLTFDNQEKQARTITMNNKEVLVVKLGEIADVNQGLATGDNPSYLFQNPEARGSYRSIEEFKEFLLTDEDLNQIRNNEKLRIEVIEKGISKDNKNSSRFFKARYIVPYDKGGESDAEGGWMPNFFVPTNYYIDWSEWAIKRMNSFTIADRIKENNELKEIKPHYKTTNAAVIRSPEKYFTDSISFSRTGIYSPTFRFGSISPFDTEGSMIFQAYCTKELLIGVLSSKFIRYIMKNFIGHTVHTQVDELKEIVIPVKKCSKIEILVQQIIKKQKNIPRYDYASHEQIEIDKLVYEAYGLNAEDIEEVETWFARRYTKLSQAQKTNLRSLGKSDDYLVLYGLKKEVSDDK